MLDLHEDDIYWCTADPGWVTGTSYGMMAPWTNGITQLIYEGGFRASAWYEMIQKHKVTVWYTAPTAIRMLMRAGDEVPKRYDMSSLRYMNSVGEPLNPEAVVWGVKVFGMPFHDNWWQTETGAIMCANYPGMEVRPGSMGRPIPGIELGIVDDDYKQVGPDTDGNLVVRPGWPSMFHTYWNNTEMYNSKFRGGWYVTGDRARVDKDGYFWFQGRADDVINTAGHLVGPFEVKRPDRASGGRGGRCHRQARPHRDGGGQGLRRAERGLRGDDRAAKRDHALQPRKAQRGRRPSRDRVRAVAPKDSKRQDHAAPAQGPRARPARGRHQHARRRVARRLVLCKQYSVISH